MIFLVVEASSSIRDSLCYVLLSFGIKGLPVSDRRGALEAIRKNPDIEGAIVDIDSKDVEGIELIKELKADDSSLVNKVIIHTIQSNKDFVIQMIEMGVVGYLLKPYKEEETYPKLKKIFTKLESHNTQRKHIRVKPDLEELLRLHFHLPGFDRLISGKIRDISLGGVAVELLNPPPEEILTPGTQIPNIQFTLQSRQFSPTGKIILYKGKVLALRFDSLSAVDRMHLARYIFKRIST